MSDVTLKFDNIRVNKKEFDTSKQPIDLKSVNVDQIGLNYFIDYQEDEIFKILWIIFSQMCGYINYFWKRGKNMSFLLEMIICCINTMKFLGNGVPNENMHYTCIACISINSVMRMEKKIFSTGLFRRV